MKFIAGDYIECVNPDYRGILEKGKVYKVEKVVKIYASENEISLEGIPYYTWMTDRFKYHELDGDYAP